jgi:hypothetical protein
VEGREHEVERAQVVLSAGGYRSGSTWAYNLCGEYLERANAGRRIGYLEPWQVPLLAGPVWSFVEAMGVAVGKAHHTPAIPEGADWTGLLADGRLVAVCSVRDWRDVLHSFTRTFGQRPLEALDSRRWRVNLDNVRWWRDNGALVVRYEDVVARPSGLLEAVAARLGLAFERGVALEAEAAAAKGVATCGGSADGFDADVDPRTLLHRAHVAHPEGGAWATWTADVRAEVDAALAPLLDEFGYAEGVRDGSARARS